MCPTACVYYVHVHACTEAKRVSLCQKLPVLREMRTQSNASSSCDSNRMGSIGAPSHLSPKLLRRVLYLIAFLDLLSVSMFYPILIQMAEARGASPTQAGLLGSLYGVLQIVSSTRMGQLSDVYGRKLGLLLSFILPAIGYLIGGTTTSLVGLFLSRITPGLFKQGISICKAYLADITDPPDVSAVLGVFTTVGNAGFIVGPLIGGYLSEWDPTFRAPFLAAGFLFLCIALLVSIVVPDAYTCQNVKNTSEPSEPMDRKHSLHSESCAKNGAASSTVRGETEIRVRPLRMLFRLLQQLNFLQGVHWKEFPDLIIERFLLTFAMLVFRQNLTPFLKGHFHIDYLTMGKILSWNGFVAMAAALLVQYISRWYGRAVDSLLQHASLLLSASLLILTLSPSLPCVIIMLAPISFATSTLRIVQLDVNLQRGRSDEKGAIVGLSSSIAAFSRTLAPVLVGILREVNTDLPGYVASVFSLFAFIVMVILPPHQTPPWLKKM